MIAERVQIVNILVLALYRLNTSTDFSATRPSTHTDVNGDRSPISSWELFFIPLRQIGNLSY